MRKFKELEIWTLGKEMALEVYRISSTIPPTETYGITAQMRRASISIPSNIAEGCSRNSNKEFNRFLEIAIGSSFELETQLILAAELNFLPGKDIQDILPKLNRLQQKINSFMTSVKKF